jgi:5-methylcytosine-specific restriction endonuclease McrA
MDEAQFRRWLMQQMRRLSYMQPGSGRSQALIDARVGYGKYQCAHCKQIFGRQEIAVDHIAPVICPKAGFVDWNTYIARLFVPKGKLQVLCRTNCHQTKSNKENKTRRQVKKKNQAV